MFGLGTPELIIILIIILLLFGGAQLPKLARSLGTSAKELRKGLNETIDSDDDKPEKSSPDKKPSNQTKK